MTNITDFILATGALGAAAFGIVEASKWWAPIGEFGLMQGLRRLGVPWWFQQRTHEPVLLDEG